MTQLRDLLAKATPRPWAWSAKPLPPHDVSVYTFVAGAVTAVVTRILGGNSEDHGDELVQELAESNAALIVAAVNALPQLLDVADAAQALEAVCVCCDVEGMGKAQGDALRTALAALNKEAK